MEALPTGAEVCVPRVTIGSVTGTAEGRYRTLDRTIRVENADPDKLTRDVWHELCHAADLQLDLDSPDADIWTFSDPRLAPDTLTDKVLSREAFAGVCELGPDAFTLMNVACDNDDALARQTTHFLADVYGGAHYRPLLVPIGGGSTTLPEGFTLTHVYPLSATAWVLWVEDEEGQNELLWLDNQTAQLVPPTESVLADYEPVPFLSPPGWVVQDHIPSAQMAIATLRLHAANGANPLRLWVDGQVGCVGEDEIVVSSGNDVWGVVAVGREVSWHRWVEE